MVLERWEEDEYFAPRAGSIAAGLASPPAPSPAAGGFDDFAPQPSSSGSTSSGRGSGSRGGAAGGGGGRTAGAQTAAASRSSGGRGDFEVRRAAQPEKRPQKKREYFPGKGTGAAALLGQLLIFEQEGTASADIETLQATAQRFSAEPMKPPSGPRTSKKDYYGSWKGMSTLQEKQLVSRSAKGGRKHTFRLTPQGRELAGRVVKKYRDAFAGFINKSDDNDDDDDDDDLDFLYDDDDNSSPSSKPFPPSRRTGAAGAASTVSSGSFSIGRPPSTSGVSPVQNPYAASRSKTTAVHAHAAEARRAKEVSSKAAAVTAMSPVGGSGTKRGRILQERGTERYEKKAKLYKRGNVDSSPLLAGLKHYDPTHKKCPSTSNKDTAPAAPAAGKKAKTSVADGLVGLDDQVMTLKSRPAPVRPFLTPSSPPPRLGATSNPRKVTPGPRLSSKPRASGGSEVPRWAAAAAPSPKSPSAAVSVEGESRSQRGQPASGISSSSSSSSSSKGKAPPAAAAAAVVGDVVDISLSDDEDDEGDAGDCCAGDDGVVMMPPPDCIQLDSGVNIRQRSASSLSGGSLGGGGAGAGVGGGGGGGGAGSSGARGPAGGRSVGDEYVGVRGPGDGGVVPLPSPFRSISRSAGAAAGSSQNGAMDWRVRGCPDWLQRELDMGTVSETDRMMDAFGLVLIVDCSERLDQVRAPIHAKLQSFLSRPSLSRAGLAAVPAGGIGLEMQVTRLHVGDFAWAWRRKRSGVRGAAIDAGEQKEMLLLDCVVERKKDNDFIDSIERTRYKAQKRRMRLSGLSRLIYLLEGDLKGCRKATTGQDKSTTIRSAALKTLAEGFVIKRVESVQGTADFLLSLSLQLMGSQGVETIREFCDSASRPKVSFQEWNAAMHYNKFEPPTVNLLFAKCLSTVNGVGPSKAWAVAREFRTPTSFVEALRHCDNPAEQAGLTQHLKLADGGKRGSVQKIGPGVAGKLVSLFADTPET